MDFERLEWMDFALCSGEYAQQIAEELDCTVTDLFFPERGMVKEMQAGKRICQGCVVQPECLDYALTEQIEDGLWGSLSGRDRKAIRRSV